jgi:hypothetical protein
MYHLLFLQATSGLTFLSKKKAIFEMAMNTKMVTLLLVVSLAIMARGATVVRIKTGTLAEITLQNRDGLALSAGSSAAGNGTLLEFGYYSLATEAAPFGGSWTALTGPNSASLVVTTIGDILVPNGTFAFDFTLDYSLTALPQDGTPLAVRFYDSTTRNSSTFFNAVSMTTGQWNWNSTGSQIAIGVGNVPGIVWQDGAASAFRTTIAVPEPSGFILIGCGVAFWIGNRRRS